MFSATMESVSVSLVFVVTIKRGAVFDLMIEAESRYQVLQWLTAAARKHDGKTEILRIQVLNPDPGG